MCSHAWVCICRFCHTDISKITSTIGKPVNPIIYFYQLQYYGNVSFYLSKQLKILCIQYFKDLKLIFAYKSICMHDFSALKIEYLNVYVHGWCISLLVVDVILLMKNRHMRTRACEHMGISPLTATNLKTTSVVHDHFILTGHTISFYYIMFSS